MRSPLPSLEGAAAWINGKVTDASLEGRPVLVHFWSIGCYLCHDVAETVATWRERYAPRGLAIVSVHQPRGPEELDTAAVERDALTEMGITQPCAVDDEHAIVERFQNQFVPSYYVFDRMHRLRHYQAGGNGYDRIVAAIERVLDEVPEGIEG